MMIELFILNTEETINLREPRDSDLFETGLVAYLIWAPALRQHIVVTSWGHLGSEVECGMTAKLTEDQEHLRLGYGTIVAIADFSTMTRYVHKSFNTDLGRWYPHWVVK